MPKLFKWLPHCGLLMVVLLIWQFNSFRRPFIIAFTLPLAFVGAFIGLLLFRAPFDFFGILGLLSLAGIIINNGIVLIDRIDSERQSGRDAYSAVIEATVSRFRPDLDDHDHHHPWCDAADPQSRPGVLFTGADHCHRPGLRHGADAGCCPRALRRALQSAAERRRLSRHRHSTARVERDNGRPTQAAVARKYFEPI